MDQRSSLGLRLVNDRKEKKEQRPGSQEKSFPFAYEMVFMS